MGMEAQGDRDPEWREYNGDAMSHIPSKRLPTPAEIAEQAARIRAQWTEREWRRRSVNHSKPWHMPVFRVCTTIRKADGFESLGPVD